VSICQTAAHMPPLWSRGPWSQAGREYPLVRKFEFSLYQYFPSFKAPLLSWVNSPVSLIGDTCPIFPTLFQFRCKRKKTKSAFRKGNFIWHLLPGSDWLDAALPLAPFLAPGKPEGTWPPPSLVPWYHSPFFKDCRPTTLQAEESPGELQPFLNLAFAQGLRSAVR
jgi:hypothetical protein